MPNGTIFVVLFDSKLVESSGFTPGLTLNANRGTSAPLGQVVFGNGSAQQIFAYIPETKSFIDAVLAFSPAIDSVITNFLDGTAIMRVSDTEFILIPQSTTAVRQLAANEVILPKVELLPNATVDYTVKSGQEELLTNIGISQ